MEKHQIQQTNPPQICPPTSMPSNTSGTPMMYTSNPYDANYIQMAIGAYLTPSASGYKCVDPYFLSQAGNETLLVCEHHFFTHNLTLKKGFPIIFPTN